MKTDYNYPPGSAGLPQSTWRHPITMYTPTIRLSFACVAILMALFACTITAHAAVTLPVPNQIRIEEDDRVATLWWNNSGSWGATNPTGVYGYQITWGLAGAAPTHTTYVAASLAQLQPLVDGQQYQAVIRAIDAYGNLSAPCPPIAFTSSTARVDALRKQMNGFFDDFNEPAGPVDELKWNVATSHDNDPASNGFFINDQYHVHSMLADKNGDRGQLVSRPRAPFIIGGRTGTVTFDFDGAQRRDIWYLDFLPNYGDINGQVNNELKPGAPGNMLRIRQNSNQVQIYWFDSTGAPHLLAQSPDLNLYHVILTPNVRRHWKVTVSQTLVEVFIDGNRVCSAPVSIPWTVATIQWNAFSYNTQKANEPQALMHWDNFGFDAPAGWQPSVVTHNYRTAPYDGSEFATLHNFVPYTTTIVIPDQLTYATGAALMFTMQTDGYQWNPKDSVTLNGKQFLIAQPTGIPGNPNDLVKGNVPYTVVIPISPGLLNPGINSLSFAMAASGVLNVHTEVYFPPRSEPPYTQPIDIAALFGVITQPMPTMPKVGPGVSFSRLNTTELWPYLQGQAFESARNVLPASGVITLTVVVTGNIALGSTGKQCNNTRLEFLVDKHVTAVIPTNTQCPSVGGKYSFTLDTKTLSNGKHELFVRGYAADGTPSVPDYFQAFAMSGDYYPLYVNITN